MNSKIFLKSKLVITVLEMQFVKKKCKQHTSDWHRESKQAKNVHHTEFFKRGKTEI